jgi:hypothetical protein
MLRFLSFYGLNALEQYYWKNGIAFEPEGKDAVVIVGYEFSTRQGDCYYCHPFDQAPVLMRW